MLSRSAAWLVTDALAWLIIIYLRRVGVSDGPQIDNLDDCVSSKLLPCLSFVSTHGPYIPCLCMCISPQRQDHSLSPSPPSTLFAGEMFPTDIRAAYHGFAATMGKLGAIIATIWFSYVSAKVRSAHAQHAQLACMHHLCAAAYMRSCLVSMLCEFRSVAHPSLGVACTASGHGCVWA